MRICYLAPAESAHIEKWCAQMAGYGHDVHVISLREGTLPQATLHCLGTNVDRQQSDFKKLAYLTAIPKVKKIIRELDPDVTHAHYASSYGLIASFACDRPYYLSVWGADVYDFPKKSPLHRKAVERSLNHAYWLMSTSKAMAQETSQYTNKTFEITPFGVDMELFSPAKRTRGDENRRYVVGTVKALEPKYGISVLLRAVAQVLENRPDIPIEVRIAGKGSQRDELENLAKELGIAGKVTWLGFISQEMAAYEWANMDTAVVMSESESESFGVSCVEAQASGVPVIYSDIPGLMEASGGGETGICLHRGDVGALARNLIYLYDNPENRHQIGARGRDYVSGVYDIASCFKKIEAIYRRNLASEEAGYR